MRDPENKYAVLKGDAERTVALSLAHYGSMQPISTSCRAAREFGFRYYRNSASSALGTRIWCQIILANAEMKVLRVLRRGVTTEDQRKM